MAAPVTYTLSLHDALPIYIASVSDRALPVRRAVLDGLGLGSSFSGLPPCLGDRIKDRVCGVERRSEEHTSELQSRGHLVCRPLLEKKRNTNLPRPRPDPEP